MVSVSDCLNVIIFIVSVTLKFENILVFTDKSFSVSPL